VFTLFHICVISCVKGLGLCVRDTICRKRIINFAFNPTRMEISNEPRKPSVNWQDRRIAILATTVIVCVFLLTFYFFFLRQCAFTPTKLSVNPQGKRIVTVATIAAAVSIFPMSCQGLWVTNRNLSIFKSYCYTVMWGCSFFGVLFVFWHIAAGFWARFVFGVFVTLFSVVLHHSILSSCLKSC